MTDRQERVHDKMVDLFNVGRSGDVVKMAAEGLAVAGELRSARPELAADIYYVLGDSLIECFEYVKGLGLLEQARALAVEAGDRSALGDVLNSLGMYHDLQGEHKKAVAEYEQSRAIAVELGNRRGEAVASHNLGLCHRSLKQYDKEIEHEELGDTWGQARTRVNLARCLSWQGQHGRAVTRLKQAWAFFQEQGDAERQARTGKNLGEALRAQAQAEA